MQSKLHITTMNIELHVCIQAFMGALFAVDLTPSKGRRLRAMGSIRIVRLLS